MKPAESTRTVDDASPTPSEASSESARTVTDGSPTLSDILSEGKCRNTDEELWLAQWREKAEVSEKWFIYFLTPTFSRPIRDANGKVLFFLTLVLNSKEYFEKAKRLSIEDIGYYSDYTEEERAEILSLTDNTSGVYFAMMIIYFKKLLATIQDTIDNLDKAFSMELFRGKTCFGLFIRLAHILYMCGGYSPQIVDGIITLCGDLISADLSRTQSVENVKKVLIPFLKNLLTQYQQTILKKSFIMCLIQSKILCGSLESLTSTTPASDEIKKIKNLADTFFKGLNLSKEAAGKLIEEIKTETVLTFT